MGSYMSSIGSSVANTMVEKQKEAQAEMQEKMVKKQQENMIKGQERMKRMQIVTQVAIARERFWWFAGFDSLLTLGLVGATVKKKAHPAIIFPWLAITLVTGYQWDFAYGNKLDRINKIQQDIEKEDHWYVPIDEPSKEEKK
ncbi:hypothetical protein ABK040_008618 [Willaertia magna]